MRQSLLIDRYKTYNHVADKNTLQTGLSRATLEISSEVPLWNLTNGFEENEKFKYWGHPYLADLFHLSLSSHFRLSLEEIFDWRSYSHGGSPPLVVIFHWRSSSIWGQFHLEVMLHWRTFSFGGCLHWRSFSIECHLFSNFSDFSLIPFKYQINGCLDIVLHLRLSSFFPPLSPGVRGCLPLKVIFHMRLFSIRSHLPFEDIFYLKSSSIEVHILLEVVFHRLSSFLQFSYFSVITFNFVSV